MQVPTLQMASVQAEEKPLRFRSTGQQQDISFLPLNSLFDKRYTV